MDPLYKVNYKVTRKTNASFSYIDCLTRGTKLPGCYHLPSFNLHVSHFLLSYLYFCSHFLYFQEFYISFSLRRCLGLKKCFQELNVLGRDGCIKEEKDVIPQQHVLCVYIHETFKLVLLHHQYPLHWKEAC